MVSKENLALIVNGTLQELIAVNAVSPLYSNAFLLLTMDPGQSMFKWYTVNDYLA